VQFARAQNLLVSVRGGGHGVAGSAICDGGLVIDLSSMRGMRVDPVAQTVRAEPGLTWGEFDRETQAFGLATTGGLFSPTGIAGLTLGGGWGWLHGLYGLACDNLLSADVVTADGRLLTASNNQNPDLFWGCGAEAATSASPRRLSTDCILSVQFSPAFCSIQSRKARKCSASTESTCRSCRMHAACTSQYSLHRMATSWLAFFLATSGRWPKASVWSSHCAA
jgi:FAD binding domain